MAKILVMNVILVAKKTSTDYSRLAAIFDRLRLQYDETKVVFSILDPDASPDAVQNLSITDLPQVTFFDTKVQQVIAPASAITEGTIVDQLAQLGYERTTPSLFNQVILILNPRNAWMLAILGVILIAICYFWYTRKRRKK